MELWNYFSVGTVIMVCWAATLVLEPVLRRHPCGCSARHLKWGAGVLIGATALLFVKSSIFLLANATRSGEPYSPESDLYIALHFALLPATFLYFLYLLFARRSPSPRYRLSQFGWGPSILISAVFVVWAVWSVDIHISDLSESIVKVRYAVHEMHMPIVEDEPFATHPWLKYVGLFTSLGVCLTGSLYTLRKCHQGLRTGMEYKSPLLHLVFVQVFAIMVGVVFLGEAIQMGELIANIGKAVLLTTLGMHGFLLLRYVDWDGTLDAAVAVSEPEMPVLVPAQEEAMQS